MNPFSSKDMDKMYELLSRVAKNTFDQKVTLYKKYLPGLIASIKEAELKQNPNCDETDLRKTVANSISTMIAYSANANGISKMEYDLWNQLFPREWEDFELFEIRHYTTGLNDYDSFCYQIRAHKTDFWTNNFLELTKYMSREDKESIAIFMFLFAIADGPLCDAEKKSIVGLLNRFN